MNWDERRQNGKIGLSDGFRLTDRLTAQSVETALADLETRWASPGHGDAFSVWPTGFVPLDEVIGGGIRPGSFTLVAGGPGVGKTTFTIQLARNLARSGQVSAIYLCFEHETADVLARLIAVEAALSNDSHHAPLSLREVRRLSAGLADRGASSGPVDTRFAAALERVREYHQRLFLVEATSRVATLESIERTVREVQEISAVPVVLVVDYLQKIPVEHARDTGDAATIAEGLKDLALRRRLGVVAVSALNEDGLRSAHNQLHHLLGGPVLTYEADAVLMFEEKTSRVARVGFEYNPQKLSHFRDWIIVSVLKNRYGRDLVNLEFQKRFTFSCFNPTGNPVSDPLIDDKLYRE